jgi:hypothetical protein
MASLPKFSATHFNSYTAASLWHRRLDRTQGSVPTKVRPRICAELVLRPVSRDNVVDARDLQYPENADDDCNAA